MKIKKYQFISGAKKAEGLTVIIDVFRAYTTAAYLFEQGAEEIYIVSKVETAEYLRDQLKNPVLIGERKGIKLKGFDYNNSPYFISQNNFDDHQIILSTSAGTKGIINAENADEIITGSFVNISATANYIKNKDPEIVSLVAMGNNGIREAEEDLLYADTLEKLIKNREIPSQTSIRKKLLESAGKRFFNENTQSEMPKQDFYYSLTLDRFNFIIKAHKYAEDIYQLKNSIRNLE
ncbi:MAG: 2-phosphosulfolactate phosphatase [Halanaerobium sp.]